MTQGYGMTETSLASHVTPHDPARVRIGAPRPSTPRGGCTPATWAMPAELEGLLLGEVPKAFLVLRSPTPPDEITGWVAARVAPHKKIRRVEVVEAIPKSPSGKILRRVLVERERAARR